MVLWSLTHAYGKGADICQLFYLLLKGTISSSVGIAMIYLAFPSLPVSRARFDPIKNVHDIYQPAVLFGAPLRSIEGREWISLGVRGTEDIVYPAGGYTEGGGRGREWIERRRGRAIVIISSDGRGLRRNAQAIKEEEISSVHRGEERERRES